MNNRDVHSASFSIPLIKIIHQSKSRLRKQQQSLQSIIRPTQNRGTTSKESVFTFRHRKVHRLLLLNSDRELDSSSQNISNLNKELVFLQGRFKAITQFDYDQIDSQIKQAEMQKQQMERSIADLKRTIQRYGNILIKAQGQDQKGELLSLQKDQIICDNKLQTIRKRYQESIQKNAKTVSKIQRQKHKIQLYQTKYSQIIDKMQEQTVLEVKLKEKSEQIKQGRKKNKTQLKRFQLCYFKKLTDLKYQIYGVQAISYKIMELQERMIKDEIYIAELNAYLSSISYRSQMSPPALSTKKKEKRGRVFSEGAKNDRQ